ncbi:hypothetical protein [Geoglobus acetivorans]|uniref:Uncharacterized protein n=1 Tax=Geoglobus acetivorans TaxID=565033 RepID=A0A0A7GG57_GEOAI|nr:hypothetical protein GACE_0893 [Geoglobus acetivorans]
MKGESNDIIYFESALIIAREIKLEKKPVHTTSRHKAMIAKAKNGYIDIRKRWYKRV